MMTSTDHSMALNKNPITKTNHTPTLTTNSNGRSYANMDDADSKDTSMLSVLCQQMQSNIRHNISQQCMLLDDGDGIGNQVHTNDTIGETERFDGEDDGSGSSSCGGGGGGGEDVVNHSAFQSDSSAMRILEVVGTVQAFIRANGEFVNAVSDL